MSSNRMQNFTYDNGDEYHGHLNARGQRHGTAVRYRNAVDGSVYEGQFRNDMRDGHGTCHWVDGTWYEGDWRDDRPHGNGRGLMIHGQYFEGQIEGNRLIGNILMRVECVVDDCHHAQSPLTVNQRLISRELATMLGHPAGDCAIFVATFRTPSYDGSAMIDGIGTLADEENGGPVIRGMFREVGRELGMVEIDDDFAVMPPLAPMTQEEQALAVESRAALKKQEQLERLARRRAEIAAAAAEQRRQNSIAKGRIKLAKFMNSKGNKGGRGKSRRKMRTKRRKHVGGFGK